MSLSNLDLAFCESNFFYQFYEEETGRELQIGYVLVLGRELLVLDDFLILFP